MLYGARMKVFWQKIIYREDKKTKQQSLFWVCLKLSQMTFNVVFEERKLVYPPPFLFLKMIFFQTRSQRS